MPPDDDPPTDLFYAPRGNVPGPPMPSDETVLRGLRRILTAVVLLPFLLGAIVILVILLGGEGYCVEKLRSIYSME